MKVGSENIIYYLPPCCSELWQEQPQISPLIIFPITLGSAVGKWDIVNLPASAKIWGRTSPLDPKSGEVVCVYKAKKKKWSGDFLIRWVVTTGTRPLHFILPSHNKGLADCYCLIIDASPCLHIHVLNIFSGLNQAHFYYISLNIDLRLLANF